MQGKLEAGKQALEGEDMALMESRLQELQEAVQKVGQEVYSKTGSVPGEDDVNTETSETDDPDNTVEGEFREV